MTRDQERAARAAEAPVVDGLPAAPGILAAMMLTPSLGTHLRGLADALLVDEFPGATISRAERELLATAVSASNDCFFCMDSHGAYAAELLKREGTAGGVELVEGIKCGSADGLAPKIAALMEIARTVRANPRDLQRDAVERATAVGATEADTQLAVLIAAGFSMFNRMVDGLRAPTAPTLEAYLARAGHIADHGYTGAAAPR